MQQGWIVKAISGFYYVLPEQAGAQLVQCRGRGILKKNALAPLVGDYVQFQHTENGEGRIDAILPRSTQLVRPPIANAQQAIIAFSLLEPDLSLFLLDKLLVFIEAANVSPVICLTKADLWEQKMDSDLEIDRVVELYESIGYPTLVCSSVTGEGIEQVRNVLAGRISVICGQSGVGKSTLLNTIIPELAQETNAISNKLGRGKHTTRHVELISLPEGGFIADTPGFSQLDLGQIEAGKLSEYFLEFRLPNEQCKFRGCLHRTEPGCRVINDLGQGEIAASRYKHYLQFLQEIQDKKRRN